MAKTHFLSHQALEKLQKELHHLKTQERARIAQAIAEAREKGDLSENAEYQAAREEQNLLELRIAELESYIATAQVFDPQSIDPTRVGIMARVQLKNLKTQKILTYQIVPTPEANPKENKISVESPLAQGLIGKRLRDTVQIQVPAGLLELEILSIEYPF